MTSSMLAPANAEAACRRRGRSSPTVGASAGNSASLLVGSVGSGSQTAAAAAKATTTENCSSSSTTNPTDCTPGLVSTSSHGYTVHHQPSLRSHVNLLHQNSELSITALQEPSQMQTQTDYFRPYLHSSAYPPAASSSPNQAGTQAAAAAAAAAAVHPMNPMAPHHPASMHSHYVAPFTHQRIGDPAAAMAAAVSAAAAAAASANNNSPTYKGYQDLYSQNNNPGLELSNPATESTPSSTGSSTSEQYRMFPARPQPTRPTVLLGGSPKPPISKETSTMQPPSLSPVHNNNNNLTPPPSVVTHHRSQQQSSQTGQNSNLGSSAALYRDKLGLNSPGGSATPQQNNPQSSPNERRLSGNSNNPKFRYPSGPSSSSSPPPPATPSSAMSSREGTPLPPSNTTTREDGPPNVDISRVQIAESDVKRENESASGIKPEPVFKREQSDSMMQHATQQQQQPEQQQQHFTGYSPSAVSTSPSTFSAQYPYLAQHQHQQAHHMGWQPHNYYGCSPLDGTNNNLMVRSLQDGLRSSSSMPGSSMNYSASSYDHQQYNYGTTIHHYGDPTAQHSVMASSGVVSRTSSAAAAAALGRGRGHHHSGSGNGVKIGRRPAHLPKVLKFHDKSLPPGWVRKLKCRKHGKQAGRWDVYIYSPCGVKFASKKKLKAFFEKNNLTYDIEEFDFTPYGRHTDSGGSGRPSGSSSGGASSGASNSNSNVSGSAGRHNSSGSTGSEGTHTGGSPASLHTYSPTHHHALHSSAVAAASSSLGTTPTSSSTYMPQSMMTQSPMAVVASVSSSDFSSFSTFDPLMENPPNASVQDVPTSSSHAAAAAAAAAAVSSDFSVASSLVASNFSAKTESSSSDYFPAEMAEILASSPAVTSSLSNGLTGSAFGPPHGLNSSAVSDYDLSRSLHHPGSLHPLSNASLESRGSTEEEGSEESCQRAGDKVSGLSKAFRALNDFNSVYSFE